jgi:hypothetical protein
MSLPYCPPEISVVPQGTPILNLLTALFIPTLRIIIPASLTTAIH